MSAFPSINYRIFMNYKRYEVIDNQSNNNDNNNFTAHSYAERYLSYSDSVRLSVARAIVSK